MITKELTRQLIGLQPVVNFVENYCAKAKAVNYGLNLPNIIVNLDSGNGQTAITQFLAEAYESNGVHQFDNLDLFVEYKLSGTLDQLREVFADIQSRAVYTNSFDGVIGMDISALSTHLHETQLEEFLFEIKKLAETALFVFYVPAKATRELSLLVAKLKSTLDKKVEMIQVDAYTNKELASITRLLLEEDGFDVEEETKVDQMLEKHFAQEENPTLSSAKNLGQMLIDHADYEEFQPYISYETVAKALQMNMN